MTIVTVFVLIFLILKTLEMAWHCGLLQHRSPTRSDIVLSWPIMNLLKRFYLHYLFRLPLLLVCAYLLVTLVRDMPAWLLWSALVVVGLALWVQIGQAFISVVALGPLETHFRRESTAVIVNTEPSPAPSPHAAVRIRLIFLAALAAGVIVAYAGMHCCLSRLDPSSFRISDGIIADGHDGPLSDWLTAIYFSTITFATVGYGDITPHKPLARFLVTTEVIASMSILVMLLFAHSLARERLDYHDPQR